jgi:hypothetical protein
MNYLEKYYKKKNMMNIQIMQLLKNHMKQKVGFLIGWKD